MKGLNQICYFKNIFLILSSGVLRSSLGFSKQEGEQAFNQRNFTLLTLRKGFISTKGSTAKRCLKTRRRMPPSCWTSGLLVHHGLISVFYQCHHYHVNNKTILYFLSMNWFVKQYLKLPPKLKNNPHLASVFLVFLLCVGVPQDHPRFHDS